MPAASSPQRPTIPTTTSRWALAGVVAGFALLAGALVDATLANALHPNQFGAREEPLLGSTVGQLYTTFVAASIVQGLVSPIPFLGALIAYLRSRTGR